MKTSLSLLPLLLATASFMDAGIDTRSLGSPSGIPFGYTGDTPDNMIDDDQDGQIDEPDFIIRQHAVGQVFRLLPGQPILSGIRFSTRDNFLFADSRDIPATFRVRVMEWDESTTRPVGEILFEGEVLTTVQDGMDKEHSIDTQNLLLTAGTSYVAFVLQEDPEPGSGNNSNCLVLARSGNPYAGGTAVIKNNGTLGIAGISAEAFTTQADLDLAIEIVSAPLPDGLDTSSPPSPVFLPFSTSGEILGNFIDDDQNGLVDEGDTVVRNHTIGQTFQVPATASSLDSITFALRDFKFNGVAPDNDVDLEFSLNIMEWDGTALHPTGNQLHTSTAATTTQDGQINEVLFDNLNLNLPTGKTYIAYLSQTDFGPATGNNSQCSFVSRDDNAYPFGQIFTKSNGTLSPEGLTTEAWTPVNADAATTFVFTQIDPATDSNGDGLPDYIVAAYGLDPGVDFSALAGPLRESGRTEVTSDPPSFGLYTPASIQDLAIGGFLIQKSGNAVTLHFGIQTSPNVKDWETIEQFQRTLTLPDDKYFMRVGSDVIPVP